MAARASILALNNASLVLPALAAAAQVRQLLLLLLTSSTPCVHKAGLILAYDFADIGNLNEVQSEGLKLSAAVAS